MKREAAAAALRRNITIRAGGVAAISLRCTRTSEVSSYVKNCNLAETRSLKKELNMWHKDTNFEMRKVIKKQDNMYRSLLKLSRTKKQIKQARTDKLKDKEEITKWKNSKRRLERRNVFSVGDDLPESSEIQSHGLKGSVFDCDVVNSIPDFNSPARFTRTQALTYANRLTNDTNQYGYAPLTISNLTQFNLKKSDKDVEGPEDDASGHVQGTKTDPGQNIHQTGSISSRSIKFVENRLKSNSTTRCKDDEVISAVANENENKPLIRRRQTISGVVEIISEPLPGLSLKSIKSMGRVGTIEKLTLLSRPPHVERLKSTKFPSLSNVFSFNEDDEVNESVDNGNVKIVDKKIQSDQEDMVENYSIKSINETLPNHLIHQPGNVKYGMDDVSMHEPSDDIVNEVKTNDVVTNELKRTKRNRRQKIRKVPVIRKDPCDELNNRSSIEALRGKVYDVTVYKKNEDGNFEGDSMCWDTTIDVAKYFNLSSHKEKLKREKLLGDAKDKETQQRNRVDEFLKKLTLDEEATRNKHLARKRAADEARLALEKRIEALKRGPPKYGTGDKGGIPSYVRNYVRPSVNPEKQICHHRKRSSWSIPSLYTLQACSNKFGSSFNSSGRGGGGSPPGIFPDASSHLVNINVDKYLLEVANA